MNEIHRGERAKAILEDPMVKDALEAIKAGIRDQVFVLPIEAREQREYLIMMDKARQQFERCFELLMQGAEIHKAELAQEAQMATRLEAARQMARQR